MSNYTHYKVGGYRAQMEPARATTLTLSPNETVPDFASMLKFADSLLRLARFCWCCATELFVTSAWTSNLHSKQTICHYCSL